MPASFRNGNRVVQARRIPPTPTAATEEWEVIEAGQARRLSGAEFRRRFEPADWAAVALWRHPGRW